MALINRVTVLVFPTDISPEVDAATGILLATKAGVVNRDVGLRTVCTVVFLGPERPGTSDEAQRYIYVAAVALGPQARALSEQAAGAKVATDASVESDVVAIAGFPTALCTGSVSHEQKGITLVRASLLYVTGIEGRDPYGRLRVYWDKAVHVWEPPEFPELQSLAGSESSIGAPHGISGGGIWRIRRPARTERNLGASHTLRAHRCRVRDPRQGRIRRAEPGLRFLQKTFTLRAITQAVRDAIDGSNAS